MTTRIVTSDLHLTDAPRDVDRWNLFPWLQQQVQKYGARELLILGDLTDSKDKHSAMLVNRFVSEIAELSQLCRVYILRANHDCVDPANPFFGFTSRLNRVTFCNAPETADDMLLLPHSRSFQEDYARHIKSFSRALKFIFCHQTFDGAVAENGQWLGGVPPSVFKGFAGQVYSGDVHVPQKVGKNIEYVGAPYRVHFGDTYKPRVLLLGKDGAKNLYFPGRGRELVVVRGGADDLAKESHEPGTQVKVRVRLKRSEFPEWPEIRREITALASRRGWELVGVELAQLQSNDREAEVAGDASVLSPEDELKSYARAKKVDGGMLRQGLAFLKEAQ